MQYIPIYKDDKDAWEGMRKAGSRAAKTLDYLANRIAPGMSTLDIDKMCTKYILKHGAIPACIGYKGYKHATCISVNDVVCHGIPSHYRIKPGDIFNVDVTVIVNGWHGDHSRMFCVPPIPDRAQELLGAASSAMMAGIGIVAPGVAIGSVETAIGAVIRNAKMSAAREYGGHGCGRDFHTAPFIGATGEGPSSNVILEEGMFFTIEPMVNLGLAGVYISKDGWTVRTVDGSLSAQWEHTIGVTRDGYEIFTLGRASH